MTAWWDTASAEVTVVPPAPTITSPTDGSSTSNADPTITGTGQSGDTINISIDGSVAGTATVGSDNIWNFTPAASLTGGSHTVVATETDAAGTSGNSNSIGFTINETVVSVAYYEANKSTLDLTAGGFSISDTAANISGGLDQLSDPNIQSITISDNGAVGVSIAQLTSDATAIAKLADQNGLPVSFAVTDTAANITGALNTLQGLNLASIIISDNGAIGLNVAQLTSDATAIAKLADQNGLPVSFAVNDTAANITGALNTLQGLNLASITISDNGAIGLNVAQLTSDATAIAKLADQNGLPYQLVVNDSAGNVIAGLSTLEADAGHISSITATGGVVAVPVSTWQADSAALDKIVGGSEISDSLPNILANLAAINADATLTVLNATSGTGTLSAASRSPRRRSRCRARERR